MKNARKLIGLFLVLPLVLFTILPNALATGKETVIKIGTWDSELSIQTMKEMVEGASENCEGVSGLEIMSYTTTTDFWGKLSSQIAAGTAPDFCLLTNEKVYEYIANGQILPLDESKIDVSTVNPAALAAWTVDGKLYGYPLEMEPNCLIINLNIWDAAGLTEADYPQTWDDVERVSKIIKEKCADVYPLTVFMEDPFHITNIVNGFGGGWNYGESIDSAENIQALDWVLNMFREGYACTPSQLGFGWDAEVIVANRAAMSTGGVWYYEQMSAANMLDRFAAVPIPSQNGGDGCIHSGALAILANTKDYDATLSLVNYMARADAQAMRAKVTGMIPSNDTIRPEYFESHTVLKTIEGAEANARPFAYPRASEKFCTNLINEITAVIFDETNNTTAAEILSSVMNVDDYSR